MARAHRSLMLAVTVVVFSVASSASAPTSSCSEQENKKSRSLLQVHSGGEIENEANSSVQGGDESSADTETCACDLVAKQIRKQKEAAFVQAMSVASPPSCELYCVDKKCDCMIPWSGRCNLNSCKACPECNGQTPAPTNAPTNGVTPTPAPTGGNPNPTPAPGGCVVKDVLIAIDASNSVQDAGWASERAFAIQLINGLLQHSGMKVSAFWFNADVKCIERNNNCPVNTPTDFHSDPTVMTDVLGTLSYQSIKDSSTDHPQVYEVAENAMNQYGRAGVPKQLILITDGETHNGKDCGSGAGAHSLYESVLGRCDATCDRNTGDCDAATQNNVCLTSQGKGNCVFPDQCAQCHTSTCMCGVYMAKGFQRLPNTNTQVVGIANGFHGNELAQFKKMMTQMASTPGDFHFVPDFAQLSALVSALVNQACL